MSSTARPEPVLLCSLVRICVFAFGILLLVVNGDPARSEPSREEFQTVTLPLAVTSANSHDVILKRNSDGSLEIKTTGTDPYVFTELLASNTDLKAFPVVTFNYFCTGGTDHFQVFVIPPLSEERSVKSLGLANSEGWSSYSLDLSDLLRKSSGPVTQLRLDFGSIPNRTIQIKNLHMRAPSEQELRLASSKESKSRADRELDTVLRQYLGQQFPCRILNIRTDSSSIQITGSVDSSAGSVLLAEAPIWTTLRDTDRHISFRAVHPDVRKRFSITVPRRTPEGRDRLLSRWCLVSASAEHRLLSHERYSDQVSPAFNLPEPIIRNKKGLGGFGSHGPESDIEDLGISTITINIVLNSLLDTNPGVGRSPFVTGGKTWYSNNVELARLDKDLLTAARHKLVVSAILLLAQPGSAPAGTFTKLICYPDADSSGIFVMPDVVHQEGVEAYAAVLNLLARRYSGGDESHGRIHHWILHNEVNAGWVWTNAGEKPPLVYMDLYQRSMRMAYLISRQYNSWSKPFISLEHHWNMRPDHIYAGRELLQDLAAFSNTEGDFEWGVAFHPYPENLFDPEVWKDQDAKYRFDTPKITFKNLEVLEAFVKRQEMRYLGSKIRAVHLTEQGLNSIDYSPDALAKQAAGMAYAWNKIKRLTTIEAFDYHNWIDNRSEGGLRIGLRRFPDDAEMPMGKKPIWNIYRAAGTASEQEVFADALTRIGLADWGQVMHTGSIN